MEAWPPPPTATTSAAALADWWAAQGRAVDVPGGPTTVWESGDGEPVVLLHGVPVSAFLFRKVLPELAARGLRGVAVDLPGFGPGPRPPAGSDQSWGGLADWTARALDALGLDRVHLVVHDIGGPIGFALAARHPERVRSLLALNTVGLPAGFRRPWAMEPFGRRGLGELWNAAMTPALFVQLMRRIGVLTPVPSVELQTHLELLHRHDRGAAFLRTMRAFERTPAFEVELVRGLADRPFPAAALWGRQDTALRLARHGEEVRALLGLDAVETVEARHFVPEDRPGEIADAVAALARQSTR
jgi:pimeloyl-ACP methyl ester carboxylesterase